MQQQQQTQLPPVPMPVFSGGGGGSGGGFIPQISSTSEPLQIEQTNQDLKNSIKETQPDKIEPVQPTDNSKYDAMTDLLYELMI